MGEFESKLSDLYREFGDHKIMVLSTSLDDRVTARTMSIVLINGNFYFQTDSNFEKCHQIDCNPNAALCIDHITVDGICKKMGKPVDYSDFICLYKKYYSNAYNMYSCLISEVLYEIRPTIIKRWIYEKGKPYVEIFDIENKRYDQIKYQV